jgi:alanyl-tRNA synthetase
MRYERHPDGSLTPLGQPGVDTGMGLERLLMVSQHVRSVYDTDLFAPWRPVLPSTWRLDPQSSRILTDHLRSAMVVIGDGVQPVQHWPRLRPAEAAAPGADGGVAR